MSISFSGICCSRLMCFNSLLSSGHACLSRCRTTWLWKGLGGYCLARIAVQSSYYLLLTWQNYRKLAPCHHSRHQLLMQPCLLCHNKTVPPFIAPSFSCFWSIFLLHKGEKSYIFIFLLYFISCFKTKKIVSFTKSPSFYMSFPHHLKTFLTWNAYQFDSLFSHYYFKFFLIYQSIIHFKTEQANSMVSIKYIYITIYN